VAIIIPNLSENTLVAVFALVTAAGAAALEVRRKLRPHHRRGARVDSATWIWPLRRILSPLSAAMTVGGVRVPAFDETKHFKMIGTTGTGKSTAICELLARALERGDRAVIADPDGGYRARFFDRSRGDVVLNPFDRSSMKWDLFAELRSSYDAEQLARALIPSVEDASGNEWRAYARTLLAAILRRCHDAGRRDLGGLWHLLVMASAEDLRPMVAGTPAQPFLDPENARMFGSIRSVLGSAIAALEHIQAQRGPLLSVCRWIREGRGSLFVPYTAVQIAALRAIIATWMRLAIFEAMNVAAGRDQRLWFVVDELDALGSIDGLKDALTRLRKFGGRCVLGFQSIAQVSAIYGANDAQTIVENCGNTLVLRCSGSENGGTSRFVSSLIGEREVHHRQISRGREGSAMLSTNSRRSTNVSVQRLTEPALLPSELEQLPDLQGYFKLASSRRWRRVSLRH
jgi:type IV secretory pathway TraG/TraD family ATPase VirD4